MRTLVLICTTAVAITMAATPKSDAMSINAGAGIKPVADAIDMTQKAQTFIVEGQRYCFYFDGWHGDGWYRCGYARRQGSGWGGEYGWQGWQYAPYERRHGGKNVEGGGKVNQPSASGSKMNTGESKDVGPAKGKVEIQKNGAPAGGANVQPSAGSGTAKGKGDEQKNIAPMGGANVQPSGGGGAAGGGSSGDKK